MNNKSMFVLCMVLLSGWCADVHGILVLRDESFEGTHLADSFKKFPAEMEYQGERYTRMHEAYDQQDKITHLQFQSQQSPQIESTKPETCSHIVYNSDDGGDRRYAIIKADSLSAVIMDKFLDHTDGYSHGFIPIGRLQDQKNKCQNVDVNYRSKQFTLKPFSMLKGLGEKSDVCSFKVEPKHTKKREVYLKRELYEPGFFYDKNTTTEALIKTVSLQRTLLGNAQHYKVIIPKENVTTEYRNIYHWDRIAGAAVAAAGIGVGAWKLFGKKS